MINKTLQQHWKTKKKLYNKNNYIFVKKSEEKNGGILEIYEPNKVYLKCGKVTNVGKSKILILRYFINHK